MDGECCDAFDPAVVKSSALTSLFPDTEVNGVSGWTVTMWPYSSSLYSEGKSGPSTLRSLTWCSKDNPSPNGWSSQILLG